MRKINNNKLIIIIIIIIVIIIVVIIIITDSKYHTVKIFCPAILNLIFSTFQYSVYHFPYSSDASRLLHFKC